MQLCAILLAAALSPQAPPPPAPLEAVPAGNTAAAPVAAPAPSTPAPALTSPSGGLEAGLAAYRKRRFAAAATEFRKAVEADPSSAAAHYYLGYCIYKQAEPKRRDSPGKQLAAQEFAKAYALDPTFRPTWGIAKK